ncbi:hypothetical protein ABN034_12680 [Actinopolymorpha sp. B11F2]|uniref:hypothetical protein n=1 Tax=Actinopolymorpha sp. B11F2 TaxID=3160862 RepID=UPI0032E4BFBE
MKQIRKQHAKPRELPRFKGRGLSDAEMAGSLSVRFATLAVLLTLGHRLPVWSPVLLVLGFVAISVDLGLMPLGGALLGAAALQLRLTQRPRPQ